VRYETKKAEHGVLVTFGGVVDETSDFSELAELSGKVTFDLEGITGFNSEGIRKWVKFIRGLDRVDEIVLVRCSVPVVAQLNLIRGLRSPVRIESFYIPYICVETGEEEPHLHYAEEIDDPHNPPPPRGAAGKTLRLNDLPERYFSFLRDFGKFLRDFGKLS
jgi:hypothetical protein